LTAWPADVTERIASVSGAQGCAALLTAEAANVT
jgi:hypothetical protein